MMNSVGNWISVCERNELHWGWSSIIGDKWTLLGENLTDSFAIANPNWEELIILYSGTSYSARSVCIFSLFLELGLSLYLVNRATVRLRHFLFAPVPGITSNRLLFCMQIFMSSNYCQMHISKNVTLDVLAKQNRKRKHFLNFFVKMNCIDFEVGL